MLRDYLDEVLAMQVSDLENSPAPEASCIVGDAQ
jgi:hypothetical protein